MIRVDYHNYSCHHLIFVRQGYAPIALVSNGKRWHSFNMRSAKTEVSSPCDEGSLFRRGYWRYPIDATSNVNDKSPWVNVVPGDFLNHKNTQLRIAGTKTDAGTWTTKKWQQIPSKVYTGNFATDSLPQKWFNPAQKASIAAFEDYEVLYNSGDIAEGYGVLYGDNSDHTMNTIDEAFGYVYDSSDTPGTDKSAYGMRGTFVYNKSTGSYGGNSVFFPIGQSGYGHRKHGDGKHDEATGTFGILRYAGGRGKHYSNTTAIKDRPMFWDLYRRPGAIYWINTNNANSKPPFGDDSKGAIGWDFNYFTFDFFPITQSNLFSDAVNTSDACFIRCVE